ncbi:MAG: chitobiase/beta-hexosaminidase C-terminal domain-containing protein [Prevotella sp.]|nr:chitobiase/beta-hexosaminidase C-terminal domain-containing protein [Prevotella sp.]
MKYKLLRFSLLCILVMLCGGSVFADDLTQYTFEKVTSASDLVVGDKYAIVCESVTTPVVAGALATDGKSYGKVDVTITDNKIVTTETGITTFTLGGEVDAYTLSPETGKYLGLKAYENSQLVTNVLNDSVRMHIDVDNSGTKIWNAKHSGTETKDNVTTTYYCYYNYNSGQSYFRFYKKGSQKAIVLYKLTKTEQISVGTAITCSFDEAEYSTTIGETFTAPTLNITPNTYDGTVVYESSNEDVATVGTDGAITIVGVGQTTITATAPATDNYQAGEASYTLTIKGAIQDGILNFGMYQDYGSGLSFYGASVKEATWTAGNITMTTAGRSAWQESDGSYRLYGVSGNNAAGSITFTALTGKIIKQITFTGSNTDMNVSVGTLTEGTWTGYANSVTFTRNTDNAIINTITVTYEEASATAPEAPTFDPAAGTYYGIQQVTVSSATDGAIIKVKQSADGEFETKNSEVTITESKTIWAYAEKDGEKSETVSATYVIGTTETSIAPIITAAEAAGKDGKPVKYTYTPTPINVEYVNGNIAYLHDGTNGIMARSSSNFTWTTGSTIKGYLTGNAELYNGTPSIYVSAIEDETTDSYEPAPTTIEVGQIADNVNKYIKIEGATFVGADSQNNKNLTFKVNDTEFIAYNKFTLDTSDLVADKAYDLVGFGVKFVSGSNTPVYEIYPTAISEKEEETGFRDIKIDLTQHTELLTESNVYITVAQDGTIGTTDDPTKAAATIKGKVHGSYGSSNFTASVPVEGCVKITYATHDYGNDIIVTNSDNEQVAKFNTNGAKWMSDHNNVVVAYYRTNEPTTLTFSNANYNPYFAVEAIAEEDLPAEVIAKPLITPSTGTYTEAQSVTITCETSGATIYYTTDGNDPTAESTAYTAAFDVTETTTVKAIAIKGDNSSEIAESVITIGSIAPGTSNLEWDYTEANIPTSGPDNGLYYGSYVNDAAGTKNGMHGVKLNGTGYAFFAKNAVEGKLTLTFGPRDGSMNYAVDVYACTIDGATATKGDKIGSISVNDAPGTGSLDIPANVTGIYIQRQTSTEGVLQKIVFKEKIARTFTDFEIPYATLKETGYTGAGLPTGVTFSGTFHDGQHGYNGATLVVPTDGGAVKFTISGCQYGNTFPVKNSANETLTTLNQKSPGCYDAGGIVTYIYSGDATTLTFGPIGYLAYFKAEAVEVTEATITYKDQNGTELGKKTVYEGDAIGESPYTEADLTIASGYKFRGWTYTNGIKVKPTDIVDGSKSVLASVTEIEAEPIVGSIQSYDLTSNIFYPEDHENFDVENANYYNNHGFNFNAGGSFSVKVAGKAQVVLSLCQYGNGTTITVTDADNNVINDAVPAKAESDGATTIVNYDGGATTLTFTFETQSYLHKVTVFNVNEFIEKDTDTGWYIVPANDGVGFVVAVNSASEGDHIFLPNGTYDLGTAALTTIGKNNISIVGESMEGVVIKNRPIKEGIAITATLLNTSTGLYMQDLTLDCVAPYGTGDDTSSAERGVALQDKGTQTILKNVYLKGRQDTYYCNNNNGQYYFEDGKIEGTVDYICGNGDAYFNKVTLFNTDHHNPSTGDCITAPNTPKQYGYIFNECTIDGVSAQDGKYSLGRPWAANTQVIFLNTTMKIQPKAEGWSEWSTDVAKQNSVKQFAEYNSVDANGNAIDLTSRKTSFKGVENDPTLTESEAQAFALETVFEDWNPAQYTEQVKTTSAKLNGNTLTWSAVDGATMYAIVKNGSIIDLTDQTSYTIADETQGAKGLGTATEDPTAAGDTYAVRAANGRGGFGEAVVADDATGIDNITTDATGINGTITEVYSMGGARLTAPQKGVNIVKVKANDGSVKTMKVIVK